jgi:glycosyltransferase involved in cell wall biosynthesis
MKKRCAVFTNIAPLYSRSLWYELSSSDKIEYSFYSSRNGFSGIRTININESKAVSENGNLNWHFLRNIFIGNIVIFQSGIISECIRTDFDAYILYGEMYTISNWISALICKIRRKPLLFWGHGLYGNEKNIKKFVRLLYYKIADYHLVYSNRSRELMISSGFSADNVFTVYNSLDFNTHSKQYEAKSLSQLEKLKASLFPVNSKLPVIIFIGRLTKEKKITYLIEAIKLCKNKGNIYNCLIIGGGDELVNLQHLTDSLGIRDLVCFFGPSYDEDLNSKFIMLSDCCVSPGNVGLTAIHSLSLGTPVITHGNYLNQGPEVESVVQDKTGMYFEENDVVSLSNVIDAMILNNKKLIMEYACIEQVKLYWNPKKQALVFDEAVMDSTKTV